MLKSKRVNGFVFLYEFKYIKYQIYINQLYYYFPLFFYTFLLNSISFLDIILKFKLLLKKQLSFTLKRETQTNICNLLFFHVNLNT